jgi:hypothetical protein
MARQFFNETLTVAALASSGLEADMAGQASSVGSRVGLDAISGRATQTARTMSLE